MPDGDALIVKTKDLLYIIDKIHEILPTVNRITAYGAPKDVLVKTPEELKTLREAGLDMVYMGAESGSDKVLQAVKKNATQAEIIEAGQKLKGRRTEVLNYIDLRSRRYRKSGRTCGGIRQSHFRH